MKASELRIGNFVFNKAKERNQLKEVYSDCSIYEPIPLTDEWLIRFGLEDKEFKGTYHFVFFDEPLQIYKSYGIWRIMFFRINRIKDLRYVHQLQNLYFTLTGTELQLQ